MRRVFRITRLSGALLLLASSLSSSLELSFPVAMLKTVGSGRALLGAGTRTRALEGLRGRRKGEGNDLQTCPGCFCLGPGKRGRVICGCGISEGAACLLVARGDGEYMLRRVATIDKRTNASHVLIGSGGANDTEIATATVAKVEN